MLKLNELRSGNVIQDIKYKTAWGINMFLGSTIVEVDRPFFDYQMDDCGEEDLNNFEQITLTKEWLIKFGYRYSSTLFDCEIYRKGIYYVSIMKGNISFGIKEDAKSKYISLVRRSDFPVHLLQNLHQDLGEELTLKQ